MSLRPFKAQFPTNPKEGDEVLIRGTLKEHARCFSVNFCLPRPTEVPPHVSPPYIAYHFKTIYEDQGDGKVIQNFKNLEWHAKEKVSDNIWHTNRNEAFTVIFRLHEEKIKVFGNDIQHNPDYEYELTMPLEEIDTIELWDDVKEVKEIRFCYDKRNAC
uniref:Galectin n=1 Tax=Anopheles atroparvus TaxID=41427 RepID=A0A182IKY0_ANOAO